MANKSLPAQFAVTPDTVVNDIFIRQLMQELERRFQAVEEEAAKGSTASADLIAVGLERLNEILLPAINKVTEITSLGFLIADSDTELTLIDDAQPTFVVNEGPRRELFTPSPFVAVTRSTTPDDYAIAQRISYTPENGAFVCKIISHEGDPGPHSDWVIAALAGPTVAAVSILNTILAARDAALAAKAAADTDSANATTKAGQAQTSANNAAISAGSAAASQTAAASSAVSAATWASNAAASLAALNAALDIYYASLASGYYTRAEVDGLIATAVANLVGGAAAAYDTLGEIASWISSDTSAEAAIVTSLAAKQPLDATLTALAALDASAGVLVQTGPDAFIKRAIGAAADTDMLSRLAADGRYPLITVTYTKSEVDTALSGKQPLDSDLTAIAAIAPADGDSIVRVAGAWLNRTMAQLKALLVLVRGDVGLGNVDNTADTAKPISTATQTALDGKQALDSDLTALAAIAPSNDDFVQRKAGAWTNRTMAQVKTDLGINNVDNTSDVNKPVSTAQAAADATKQPLDADLTAIAALVGVANDVIQFISGAWTNRTMAQLKTALALVKGDVGLGNVDNTADTAKPVSTAQQTAIDAKQPLDADLTTIAGLTATTDNFMQSKASAWASRTPAQVKTDLAISNLDNTSDANKPVSTAQATSIATKQPLDADLTAIAALAPAANDVMQFKAGAWVNRTIAQLLVDLGMDERGTFTPVFTASTTGPTGVTYSSRGGWYVKNGGAMHLVLSLVLTNKGAGGAGNIIIQGAPYSGGSGNAVLTASVGNTNATSGSYFTAQLSSGAADISIREGALGSATPTSAATWANASNSSTFGIGGTVLL